MPKGTIKRLIPDRRFGFITADGQEKDLFFHGNELQGVDYSSLTEGQELEFEISTDAKGRSAAVKVKLAETENNQGEAEAETESDQDEAE
jgi:CspA family cold shock protein